MQELIAPGRAKSQQGLANNLFASGRMGAGSAAYEGGGYLNPERMEYLTAMNREDSKMAFDSTSRARSERLNDMQTGLGYYGTGNNMRMDPYNDVMKLFGMGSTIETAGQGPFNMGMGLGTNALSGDRVRSDAYMNAAQTRLGSDQANIGMFTNLVGQGAKWASGGGTTPGGYGMPGTGTPGYGTTDYWKGSNA